MRYSRLNWGYLSAAVLASLLFVFNNCSPEESTEVPVDGQASSPSTTEVVQPLSVSPASITINSSATANLQASGGKPPYTITLVGGVPGSLSNVDLVNGRATYVPNDSQGSAAQILITDSSGSSASAAISVTMLQIQPVNPTLQATRTLTFSAQNGVPPYTFSVVSGGGSFAGAVYTAPTTAGTAVVRATDAAGKSVQTSVTLTPRPQQTFSVGGGSQYCNNAYCACVTPGQLGVPYATAALDLCRAAGYTQLVTFSTSSGVSGGLQCAPGTASCFVNQNPGNLICSSVTCQ